MTVLAGVDAGASHTEALIGTTSLAELARVRGAPGNLGAGDVRDAAQAIATTVAKASREAEVGDPIEVLVVGAAGARLDTDRQALQSALLDLSPAKEVLVTSDALVALESAFPEKPGILLIAGTGSIAHARDPSGNLRRVGGFGSRFGDEGSGYALGRAAVGAAIAGHEGRGPETRLTRAVLDAVGVESMDQFPAWAQDHEVSLVAQLAITACQVADGGDEVAGALVAEAARALADHVIALLPRFPSDAEVLVALWGGLIGSDTPVRQRLLAELATRVPNVCVTDVEVDPAFGALRMAAKKFGLK